MVEIEFKTNIYYTGRVTVGLGGVLSVSDLSVWVEVDDSDIDITNTLDVDQLESAKKDFISRYEEKQDTENLKNRDYVLENAALAIDEKKLDGLQKTGETE